MYSIYTYIFSKSWFKIFSLTLFETRILSGEYWHNVTHGCIYWTNENFFRIAAILSILIAQKAVKTCVIENSQGKLMIDTKHQFSRIFNNVIIPEDFLFLWFYEFTSKISWVWQKCQLPDLDLYTIWFDLVSNEKYSLYFCRQFLETCVLVQRQCD